MAANSNSSALGKRTLDKKAKAEAKAKRKAQGKERRTQMWQAFQLQRKEDPRLVPYMIAIFLAVLAVFILIAALVGGTWFGWLSIVVPGALLGALVAFIFFSRRAQKSVYSKAEGQAGAPAWVLQNMRGQWRVTPGIAATQSLDAVHRVIGRPGVILVGEGDPQRTKTLLAQEKKRISKLVGNTPIYTIVVGTGEDQVSLADLEKHLTKLPNNITTNQLDALESRMNALNSKVGPVGLPKGPVPQGAKVKSMQRAARRR